MIHMLIVIFISQWTVADVNYHSTRYYDDVEFVDSINASEGYIVCDVLTGFKTVQVRDILSHEEVLNLSDRFCDIEMIPHGEDSVLIICQANVPVPFGGDVLYLTEQEVIDIAVNLTINEVILYLWRFICWKEAHVCSLYTEWDWSEAPDWMTMDSTIVLDGVSCYEI